MQAVETTDRRASWPALSGPPSSPAAVDPTYWSAQAEAYAPPYGRGVVRFTARSQHAACMRLVQPRGGERVLDAGCGTGLLTRALAARGARVWAVDSCPAMLRHVRGAERVLRCDIERLDLGEEFDAVVCAGALNFLDARRAIPRLAKHTKKGGILVVSVTRRSVLGFMYAMTRRLARVSVRLYSVRFLVDCLREHGFELVGKENMLPHDAALAFARRMNA